MKCPRCGNELRRSRKDPSFGLCDNCRKKFRLSKDSPKINNSPSDYPNSDVTQRRGTVNTSKQNKQNKKGCLIKCVIAFILFIVVIVVASTIIGNKSISMPDVVGMAADRAHDKLEDKGFTDIVQKADDSSESKHILNSKNWTVVSQNPKAKSKAKAGETVTIVCKKTSEVEKDKKNKSVEQFEAFIGAPVFNTMDKVQEIGYTATYIHATSGEYFTTTLEAFTSDELAKWIITEVGKVDTGKKTVQLKINTTDNIANDKSDATARDALSSKLDPSYAWQAVDAYGKDQYPYGFKLHYVMDKQSEKVQDENTWFLKSSATVKNASGAEVKMTCEAYVTGTTDNPKVTEFNAY